MDENIPNETQQSAWNLSQMLIFQINALLQEVSALYTRGYLQESFFKAREIRFLVFADLNEEEKAECNRLEGIFRKLPIEQKNKHEAHIVREVFLTKYREYIFTLLQKYGYLISKKEDTTRMY